MLTKTLHSYNRAAALEAFAKMEKKAAKYGVGFTWYFGPDYQKEEVIEYPSGLRKKILVDFFDVTVDEKPPVVGPFKFIATLEFTPDGKDNYTNVVPGETIDPKYHHAAPDCDHCKVKRFRADVFVVQNTETGVQMQVGRSCLRDFLDTDTPDKVLRHFEFYRNLFTGDDEDREFWGYGRAPKWYETLDGVLSATMAAIRLWGWLPKGACNDSNIHLATANRIGVIWRSSIALSKSEADEKRDILAEMKDTDVDVVEKVKEYVANLKDDGTNDYIHNLKLAFKSGQVDHKRIGIVCSSVSSYFREVERQELFRRENEGKPVSSYVGTVKERLRNVKMKLLSQKSFESAFGTSTLIKLVDENGNRFAWFSSVGGLRADTGAELTVTGTVKEHKEYQGVKETYLSRVKALDDNGKEV